VELCNSNACVARYWLSSTADVTQVPKKCTISVNWREGVGVGLAFLLRAGRVLSQLSQYDCAACGLNSPHCMARERIGVSDSLWRLAHVSVTHRRNRLPSTPPGPRLMTRSSGGCDAPPSYRQPWRALILFGKTSELPFFGLLEDFCGFPKAAESGPEKTIALLLRGKARACAMPDAAKFVR